MLPAFLPYLSMLLTLLYFQQYNATRIELSHCGECEICLSEDCGECAPCIEEILGHPVTKLCELKECPFMRYAPPEVGPLDAPIKVKSRRGETGAHGVQKQVQKYAKHSTKSKQKRCMKTKQSLPKNDKFVECPFKSLSIPSDNNNLQVLSIQLGSTKKKVIFLMTGQGLATMLYTDISFSSATAYFSQRIV